MNKSNKKEEKKKYHFSILHGHTFFLYYTLSIAIEF
jgi:hypothetical protein